MRRFGASFMFLVVVFSSRVAAAETVSWVGKTILLKHDNIQVANAPKGKLEETSGLTDPVYEVVKESEGWIAVRLNDKESWLEREQAVLMANAMEYFSDRILDNPKDYAAYLKRACVWEAKGDLDHAIGDVTEALRLRPRSNVAYYNRALYHGKLGRHDLAIEDYTAALQHHPDFTPAYLNRGIARVRRGDHDKAVRDFTAAIRLEPSYVAYFNRGVAQDRLGSYDSAIEDFSTAIRLQPKDASAYRARAHSYSAKKDFRKALADYRESIRLDAQNCDGYNGAAWILATCRDPEVRNGRLALEYARKACNLDGGKEPSFLGTLAAACAANDEFDNAVKWQEKALESREYANLFGDLARGRLQRYKERKALATE